MACYHGGAFWSGIGEEFQFLHRRSDVVNADVLDAWFPPAPRVLVALGDDPGWQARTSPPTHAEGLVAALSRSTGIDPARILPGPGSSSLVFLAFARWLRPGARILVLDPSYGEYAHVGELAGATVHRFTLDPPHFTLDLDRWTTEARDYDLAIVVNPNNPTGQAIPAPDLEAALRKIPASTRIWIDEAYAPGSALDLAHLDLPNLFVVRSMSKAFALSGLRAAYLVGPEHEIDALRSWMPPWAVSLPAQIAAVAALSEPDYYRDRYADTALKRHELAETLGRKGLEVESGAGNWALARLPLGSPNARDVCERLATEGIYIRDAGRTSPALGDRYLRIAVRPDSETAKILEAL